MSPATVKPTTLGSSTVNSSKDLQTSDSKWIGLKALEWTDEEGKQRRWEVAGRKTTAAGGVDGPRNLSSYHQRASRAKLTPHILAVAIAAFLKHPSRPLSIPIILQYRPPISSICVELPAGLIDKSESAEEAALRELYEETGYGGKTFEGRIKVVQTGGIVPSDPGMSNANMQLCSIEVDLKEGEADPVAQLDEGAYYSLLLEKGKKLTRGLPGEQESTSKSE
ncbi:hypothetical protein P7C70_g3798, partial [Phenoliferia sp. Uapishka_3]